MPPVTSRVLAGTTDASPSRGAVVVGLRASGGGFDADGRSLGRLRPTGLRPKFLEKMAYSNVTVDPMVFATDRM